MQTLFFFLALLIAVLVLYLAFIRPRQLRWGATDEEVAQSMPGDDRVKNPNFVATRAVTVQSPPSAIWPWLLQIGSKRAGFYSLDWLDNAGKPSSNSILPEFQNIQEGDFIPMTPDQKSGMWVERYETHRYILWRDQKGWATWVWLLTPIDQNRTRLITRLRTRYDWTLPWVIYYLIYDFGDIVMMSRCLLGIKRRAEAMH